MLGICQGVGRSFYRYNKIVSNETFNLMTKKVTKSAFPKITDQNLVVKVLDIRSTPLADRYTAVWTASGGFYYADVAHYLDTDSPLVSVFDEATRKVSPPSHIDFISMTRVRIWNNNDDNKKVTIAADPGADGRARRIFKDSDLGCGLTRELFMEFLDTLEACHLSSSSSSQSSSSSSSRICFELPYSSSSSSSSLSSSSSSSSLSSSSSSSSLSSSSSSSSESSSSSSSSSSLSSSSSSLSSSSSSSCSLCFMVQNSEDMSILCPTPAPPSAGYPSDYINYGHPGDDIHSHPECWGRMVGSPFYSGQSLVYQVGKVPFTQDDREGAIKSWVFEGKYDFRITVTGVVFSFPDDYAYIWVGVRRPNLKIILL